MKRMLTIIALFALLAAPAAADDVYRWVDEDGVVHYSDQAREGAEKVEIREPQTFSSSEATPAEPSARDRGADGTPALSEVDAYTAVRIVQPEHDAVAWNIGGEFAVEVAVEPRLDVASGHRVVVFLDGQAVPGTPVASTSIGLTGLHRGSYELRAAVIGADDRQIIESDAITFHVRQTSIQNPQRGR